MQSYKPKHECLTPGLSVKYFLQTNSSCFETEIGSRNNANALKVAFTTLCGLAEPKDFANTSVTPALSKTARIEPPAITPVP